MVNGMTLNPSAKALLFDLDGTIIDSFSQIAKAANLTRNLHGFEEIAESSLIELIGLPAENLFKDLEGLDVKSLVKCFRSELNKLISRSNTEFPFALQFIKLSRLEGFKIGVATSKPQPLANNVIKNSIFLPEVDHIAGTEPLRPKPHPDVIESCLEAFDTRSALMFGDRPEDLVAAKNAGIPSVGIAQGAFSIDALLDAGASCAYSSFEVLYQKVNDCEGGIRDFFRELL
jgi:phosphoglycolate phosphatase-like HAD superfamily hydrolase